jgi:uncharacterized protein YciI
MRVTTKSLQQRTYFVVFITTRYASLQTAMFEAPDDIAAHIARSKVFHERGDLLMGGAFLDQPEAPVSTMAILVSRQVAEEYAQGDPFVLKGMVSAWTVREWANMLR